VSQPKFSDAALLYSIMSRMVVIGRGVIGVDFGSGDGDL
jgi:pyruvate/2-oxoglutarate dehydrogenase complex dihydrolipoamide dehydrogenase (E3) component